ncbi:MAG TPA: VOC family protein [Candidatus Sulfotelmatobacter sp.]|nr:VOC family protein [Candidatus Sulfotelmatobacter sp.]
MRLRSLQHVSSPYPDGARPSVRRFYGEVLGLREQPAPSTLADMRLLWFSAGKGLELHFFPGPVDAESRRHFCFDIDDLEETRRRLQDAGLEPFDDTPIPNRPRFFCRDPVGNLVEFTRIEGDYQE